MDIALFQSTAKFASGSFLAWERLFYWEPVAVVSDPPQKLLRIRPPWWKRGLFLRARKILKRVSRYSGTEFSKRELLFHFKANFDTIFRLSWSFSGKRDWFVQMVNAIPGRNSSHLNFAYHLWPKPWTDWFAHVRSGKQPRSLSFLYGMRSPSKKDFSTWKA